MNKELACRCTNKNQAINLGRHLDKVEYKWFNETTVE